MALCGDVYYNRKFYDVAPTCVARPVLRRASPLGTSTTVTDGAPAPVAQHRGLGLGRVLSWRGLDARRRDTTAALADEVSVQVSTVGDDEELEALLDGRDMTTIAGMGRSTGVQTQNAQTAAQVAARTFGTDRTNLASILGLDVAAQSKPEVFGTKEREVPSEKPRHKLVSALLGIVTRSAESVKSHSAKSKKRRARPPTPPRPSQRTLEAPPQTPDSPPQTQDSPHQSQDSPAQLQDSRPQPRDPRPALILQRRRAKICRQRPNLPRPFEIAMRTYVHPQRVIQSPPRPRVWKNAGTDLRRLALNMMTNPVDFPLQRFKNVRLTLKMLDLRAEADRKLRKMNIKDLEKAYFSGRGTPAYSPEEEADDLTLSPHEIFLWFASQPSLDASDILEVFEGHVIGPDQIAEAEMFLKIYGSIVRYDCFGFLEKRGWAITEDRGLEVWAFLGVVYATTPWSPKADL